MYGIFLFAIIQLVVSQSPPGGNSCTISNCTECFTSSICETCASGFFDHRVNGISSCEACPRGCTECHFVGQSGVGYTFCDSCQKSPLLLNEDGACVEQCLSGLKPYEISNTWYCVCVNYDNLHDRCCDLPSNDTHDVCSDPCRSMISALPDMSHCTGIWDDYCAEEANWPNSPCTWCHDPNDLLLTGQYLHTESSPICVDICPAGTHMSNSGSCLTSEESVEGCVLATFGGVCLECEPGRYPVSGGEKCSNIPPCNIDNCRICSSVSPDICDVCEDFYFKKFSDKCDKCPTGYHTVPNPPGNFPPAPYDFYCIPCLIDGCGECEYLQSGGVGSSTENYNHDPAKLFCTRCADETKVLSQIWLSDRQICTDECIPGTTYSTFSYIFEYQIYGCEYDMYLAGAPYPLLGGPEKYFNGPGPSVFCEDDITNCHQCGLDNDGVNRCVRCFDGYVAADENRVCVECAPPNCASCSDVDGTCDKCIPPFHLYNGACVPCSDLREGCGLTDCLFLPFVNALNEDTAKYTLCDDCDGGEYTEMLNDFCTKCESDRNMIYNHRREGMWCRCINETYYNHESDVCNKTCSDGTILFDLTEQGYDDKVCVPCPPECAKCEYMQDVMVCTECNPGSYLSVDNGMYSATFASSVDLPDCSKDCPFPFVKSEVEWKCVFPGMDYYVDFFWRHIPINGSDGFNVQFFDISHPQLNYRGWDFDLDGMTDSIEENPVHEFPEIGTLYDVLLFAGNPHYEGSIVKPVGCEDSLCGRGYCWLNPLSGDVECYNCDPRWTGVRCEINMDIGEYYPPDDTKEDPSASENYRLIPPPTEDDARRDHAGFKIFENFEKTIMSICVNEYYGIIVTTDRELYIFGEHIDNDYIAEDTNIPIFIDTSTWNAVPFKVVCTRTSLFVLGMDIFRATGTIFMMGRNENFELNGGNVITKFKKDQIDVHSIHASYHTLYVVYETDEINPGVFDIRSIGDNNYGEFAAGSNALNSMAFGDTYISVDSSSFPVFGYSGMFGYEYYTNYYGIGDQTEMIYPIVIPFEHGVVFKFGRDILFFAGKDHPSLGGDVNTPQLIDFTNVPESELQNYNFIDHISRLYGGCLFIVSDNQIYVSGNAGCGDSWGIERNQLFSYPFQIQEPIYGDFTGDQIYQFYCSWACYILTENDVFVFGRISDGIGLDAVGCNDENCKTITHAATDVEKIVPISGNRVTESATAFEKYGVIYLTKPPNFNTYKEEEVYKFPPVMVFEESGMSDDHLTLVFKQESIFQSLISTIEFYDLPSNGIQAADKCIFPRIVESEWEKWVEIDPENGDRFIFHKLNLPWNVHAKHGDDGGCHWTLPTNNSRTNIAYDVYSNRIHYNERHYRGMLNGNPHIRKEQFIFDVHVRFPKQVMKVEITVQQDVVDDWFEFYISDKTFDRVSRKGSIVFSTVGRKPNFLVFSDIEHHEINVDFRQPRVGETSPNVPEYFIPESFAVVETNTGETTPDSTSIICDEERCYQNYRLDFQIISDHRVCFVPDTIIPINFITFCVPESMSSSNCIAPSQELTFEISLNIDNLCAGELFVDINTEFVFELFSDWSYLTPLDIETEEFQIGDWLYFRCTLISEKVNIVSVNIDTVSVVSVKREFYNKLYRPISGNSAADRMFSNTENGDNVMFTIDDLPFPNQIGFHFQLSNEILNLQPGETDIFEIQCYLSVMYEGNEQSVITFTDNQPDDSGRRNRRGGAEVNIGQTFVTRTMEINVLNDLTSEFTIVPYIVVSTFVIVAAVVFAVLIMMGIVSVVLICKKRKVEE